MLHREGFNLINSPKEFNVLAKDDVDESSLHFHGPIIRDSDELEMIKSFPFEKLTRPKTIYISLGTISGG